MIIALTGTPGVGKTAVANELAKELAGEFEVISLNTLVRKYKIEYSYDRKRKAIAVGTKKLSAAARKEAKGRKNIVFDGHLSQFLDADIVVVLRCMPDVLKRRMKKKDWSDAKIRENLEAEILDVATTEALQKHGKFKVVEIDSTKKSPKQLAALIKKILNNHARKNKYRAGKLLWKRSLIKKIITAKRN